MSLHRRALLVTAIVAALACVPTALADGDPASDYLLSQSVFAPYDSHIPDARAAQLRLLVKEAKARGFPVKIALVGTRPDLGTVIVLWRRPEQYARFLGQELRNWYRGPLLIVMPNGYGFSANGKAVARDQETLAGLPSPGRAPDLETAGIDGVRRLARQRGIQLAVPKAPHVAAHRNQERALIGVGVGAIVLIGLAVYVMRRRWLPGPEPRSRSIATRGPRPTTAIAAR